MKSKDKLYIYDQASKVVIQTILKSANRIFLGQGMEKDKVFYWLKDNYIIVTNASLEEIRKYEIGSEWIGGWYNENNNYIFLFSNSKIQSFKIANLKLKNLCAHYIPSAPPKPEGFVTADNNLKYLTITADTQIYILGINDCSFRKEIPINERFIFSLKLHYSENLVVIGGWFENVIVYDFEKMTRIFDVKLQGPTLSLQFLYDEPSLLILKEKNLFICSIEKQKCQQQLSNQDNAYLSLSFQEYIGSLYLLTKKPSIIKLSYSSSPKISLHNVTDIMVWSISHYMPNYYLVGASTNILYIYDYVNKKTDSWQALHSQGITRLMIYGTQLISASDDKKIKFSYPIQRKITKEIQAHDTLVNYLYPIPSNKIIYTVSSDGHIKEWNFPEFYLKTDIPGFPALAFCWVNEDNNIMFISSWRNIVYSQYKKDDKWIKKSEMKINSESIYNLCYIKAINSLLLVGTYPSILYLYNVDKDKVYQLDFITSQYHTCQTIDDYSVAVGGSGIVAVLKFNIDKHLGLINYNSFII